MGIAKAKNEVDTFIKESEKKFNNVKSEVPEDEQTTVNDGLSKARTLKGDDAKEKTEIETELGEIKTEVNAVLNKYEDKVASEEVEDDPDFDDASDASDIDSDFDTEDLDEQDDVPASLKSPSPGGEL